MSNSKGLASGPGSEESLKSFLNLWLHSHFSLMSQNKKLWIKNLLSKYTSNGILSRGVSCISLLFIILQMFLWNWYSEMTSFETIVCWTCTSSKVHLGEFPVTYYDQGYVQWITLLPAKSSYEVIDVSRLKATWIHLTMPTMPFCQVCAWECSSLRKTE